MTVFDPSYNCNCPTHTHTHTHMIRTKCQKVCKESGQKGLNFFILMLVWDLYFLEGQIVSHVCVKGLNNNVNSFCTEVGKHTFWTVWRTSAITTQTPHSEATWLLWCSKLYITWMLWALGIRSCKQNMILATDLCMAEVNCCNSWCLSSCNYSSFF